MIRDTFQPELDEFAGDLESYATGSYLSEEDRENWFEPFDVAAVAEVRDVVERYFDALDALSAQREPASQEALMAVVDRVTADLNAVNANHDDAVLEPEERETLVPLLIRAARAAGLACLEAMWTRFLPRTDIVRQLLADGALGDVESVVADHGQYFEPDTSSRLFAPELAGGALLDLGIYPVSYAAFVLGRPGRVTARGTLTDTGVDRQVAAVLEGYDTPAHAIVHTTLAARTPTAATISGPDARVELDGSFYAPGSVRLVTREGDVAESPQPAITGSDGLCHEASHLAQLVADGATESPLLGLDETVAIMQTLDEIRRQVGVRYPGEDGLAAG